MPCGPIPELTTTCRLGLFDAPGSSPNDGLNTRIQIDGSCWLSIARTGCSGRRSAPTGRHCCRCSAQLTALSPGQPVLQDSEQAVTRRTLDRHAEASARSQQVPSNQAGGPPSAAEQGWMSRRCLTAMRKRPRQAAAPLRTAVASQPEIAPTPRGGRTGNGDVARPIPCSELSPAGHASQGRAPDTQPLCLDLSHNSCNRLQPPALTARPIDSYGSVNECFLRQRVFDGPSGHGYCGSPRVNWQRP